MNVDIEYAIKARNDLIRKQIKISDTVRALRSKDLSKLSYVDRRSIELDLELGDAQVAELQRDIDMFQANIDRQMNELELEE